MGLGTDRGVRHADRHGACGRPYLGILGLTTDARSLYGVGACGGEFHDPSADALVEIDHLGPIHPSIDEADRSAFRAAEVGADVVPVPVRQVAQPEPAVVVASLMIALRIGG